MSAGPVMQRGVQPVLETRLLQRRGVNQFLPVFATNTEETVRRTVDVFLSLKRARCFDNVSLFDTVPY